MRTGILVASFGTTYQDTREKNIDAIVKCVKEKYKDVDVYEAYTSSKIRKALEKDGIKKYSVEEALEIMAGDGITHVAILPTHVIDGIESEIVKADVLKMSSYFEDIKTAGVLLNSPEDYRDVCDAVWGELKEPVREDTLILMGHGTEHKADESYGIMEDIFRKQTGADIYIATVEGETTIDDVIIKMKEKNNSKRVIIAPFMLVAGDHANNDMAGDEDSFKSKLHDEGFEPECIIKGLGEYEDIRKIYISHLDAVMN